MYIFSKKKYAQNAKFVLPSVIAWASVNTWVIDCDGKEVKDGSVVDTFYECSGINVDRWCVDTEPLMKRFINEKIAVRTGTGEHLNTFLKMCEEAGLRWAEGQIATKYTPPKNYGEFTCICSGFLGKKLLGFQTKGFYIASGYKVIDFLDFINLEVEDKRELVVPLDELKRLLPTTSTKSRSQATVNSPPQCSRLTAIS